MSTKIDEAHGPMSKIFDRNFCDNSEQLLPSELKSLLSERSEKKKTTENLFRLFHYNDNDKMMISYGWYYLSKWW